MADPRGAAADPADASTPGKRRIDPHRRKRIIEATLDVIVEHGIGGLSHRRVAKAAGASLGATNYYFGSRDDLIEAAFAESIERDRALIARRLGEVPPDSDPIAAMAAIVSDQIADRDTAVRAMELLTAAIRNERLRALQRVWDDAFYEPLISHFGEDRARMAGILMESLVLYGLVAEPPMTTAEIAEFLRKGLDSSDG